MLSGMAGTIVIGYDDSEGADRALDHAIAEATSSGDSLVVVSVLERCSTPKARRTSATSTRAPR